MTADDYGPLAAALSKAQAAFPPIQRDKEVTVKSQRTGGQYTFKYAPLDTILSATRPALTDNGLAVVQLLDDGELVTMLLHESGARLSGRVALGENASVQDLGSAITYLRRYSLQAILGIAAEEDDDGNRASGNVATPVVKGETESLVGALDRKRAGTISRTKSRGSDLESREQPDGTTHIGFRLETAKGLIEEVWAEGDAAGFLFAVSGMDPSKLEGEHATVDGLLYRVTEANRKAKHRLKLTYIEVLGAFWPPAEVIAFPAPQGATETSQSLPPEDKADLDALPWPDSTERVSP